ILRHAKLCRVLRPAHVFDSTPSLTLGLIRCLVLLIRGDARRMNMETTPNNRSKREWEKLQANAGNGLLDRRAFLRGGAAVAGAMMGYTFVGSAAAEPLVDDPWSLVPGAGLRPYEQRSRFEEKAVARTLDNPKGEPRTERARTPHQLIHGTLTPNGLHFIIVHGRTPNTTPTRTGRGFNAWLNQ